MGGTECSEHYGALPAYTKMLLTKIERVVINALEFVATS
jgi:hypothetical protein